MRFKENNCSFVPLSLVLLMAAGCASRPTSPTRSSPLAVALLADDPAKPAPTEPDIDWKKEIGDVIAPDGGLDATLNAKERVYTVTIPRTDLDVMIDGMSVPTAAGIASTFRFYKCSCGKMSVLGEFIVADYEANDVIDALRPGAIIRVTGVGPIAIGDRPKLLSIRFHGEGEATALAKLIRAAMDWTGEARNKRGKNNE